MRGLNSWHHWGNSGVDCAGLSRFEVDPENVAKCDSGTRSRYDFSFDTKFCVFSTVDG